MVKLSESSGAAVVVAKSTKKKKPNPWPFIFIAPFAALYLVFNLFPTLYSFYVSLTDWKGFGAWNFVGLKNYIKLVTTDPFFAKAIWNTVLFLIFSLPLQTFFGLLMATLLYSRTIKLKRFFQTGNFLPYITIPVAIGVLFALVFDFKNGLINQLLLRIGLIDNQINWLGRPTSARIVIIGMLIWRYFGYSMIIYLAGMAAIDQSLYESAMIDGASALQSFRLITIPLLRNVTIFLVITGIIGGLQLFDEPKLLIQGVAGVARGSVGGPQRCCLTAVWYLYDEAFSTFTRFGKSASIGYSLFLVIAAASYLGFRFMKREPV